MNSQDYARIIRMMNDMFETNFFIPRTDICDEIEKGFDEDGDKVHGYMKRDVYLNGKHINHEEKELREGGWVPVKGNSVCYKQEKDESKDTPDSEVKSRDEIIDSLTEANRCLTKENSELKSQLNHAMTQMNRFSELMKGIEASFKKFNEK